MVRVGDHETDCFFLVFSTEECTDMLLDKFDVSKSKLSRFWVSLPGEKPYLPNIENEKAKLNELDLSPKHVCYIKHFRHKEAVQFLVFRHLIILANNRRDERPRQHLGFG